MELRFDAFYTKIDGLQLSRREWDVICTTQKMKFSIKGFFIFCAVLLGPVCSNQDFLAC